MKKFISTVFALLMTLTFVACGGNVNENVEPAESSVASNAIEESEQSDSEEAISDPEPTFDTSLIGSTFASGDYEYTVQENGTVYISGYIGTDSEITIPIELDGFSVTGIQEDAFRGNDTIETLVVPGQIKSIGERAFYLSNLIHVTIEDGVESIGAEAFLNGVNDSCLIVDLEIADSVYKMGYRAFGKTNQVSRDINGLSYIGNVVVDFADSFDGHIVFDENTKGIADGALCILTYPATEILDETIAFPEGILYIGNSAFESQSRVYNFRVPSSVVEIGSYAMHFQYINRSHSLYNSNATRKIYGMANSVAEQYAKSNELNFVIVSD